MMTEPSGINMYQELSMADKNNGFFQNTFIKFLFRKWWLFLIIGFLSGLGGVFYASLQKPVYQSRLTFALDAGANDGSLSSAMSLAAQFGFGFGGGQSMFDGDNILEILKSRRIIENVFLSTDTFNGKVYTLADYYLQISGLRLALDKKPHLKNISFPPGLKRESLSYLQDSIINNLFINFSSEYIYADRPDKKLSLYQLNVKTPDEKLSKVFTDRLIDMASSFYTEITSKKDKETLEILEQRVLSLKSNVGTSIDTRAAAQDANVNPAFAAAQSQGVKQQYNMQAYGEAYKEMFKTLEMARYQYLKKIPLLQIVDHADYPMKKIKTSKLKSAILFSVLSVLAAMLCMWCYTLFKKQKAAN